MSQEPLTPFEVELLQEAVAYLKARSWKRSPKWNALKRLQKVLNRIEKDLA